MSKEELSVIIPIYNEAKTLPALYGRTLAVLKKLNLPYEIIFVDDGSADGSLQIIKNFNDANPSVKALSFSRNFGHQIAITAGLNFSKGKIVIVMDGDLQDPPEVMEHFIEKWREGYEVVYGTRTKRKDNIIKLVCCNLYYRLLILISETHIDLDSGDFCLMDRKIVDLINNMPERNRFIRGLRNWVGFKHASVQYNRDKRYSGKAKYSLSKLLKLGFDGIVSFSKVPLKISISLGFIISMVSLAYSFYVIWGKIFRHFDKIPGWTSLAVGITFLGGIQLMVTGLLAEYIIRIYDEVKGRPLYVLRSYFGFDKKENVKGIGDNPGA